MDAETTAAPRVLARVSDYSELADALRARVRELDVTHQTVDEVSGLQNGYFSKLAASPPIKSLGLVSLGPVLGALGLALQIVEDEAQLARVRNRLTPRKYRRPWRKKRMLTGREEPVTFKLTREHLRRISALAAKARMDKISPRRRRQIARKAAAARWSTPRLVEITGATRNK